MESKNKLINAIVWKSKLELLSLGEDEIVVATEDGYNCEDVVKIILHMRANEDYRDVVLKRLIEINGSEFLNKHRKYIGTQIKPDGTFKCDANVNMYACGRCEMENLCGLMFLRDVEEDKTIGSPQHLTEAVKEILETGKYSNMVFIERFVIDSKTTKEK